MALISAQVTTTTLIILCSTRNLRAIRDVKELHRNVPISAVVRGRLSREDSQNPKCTR
jgi:hypothetical protein